MLHRLRAKVYSGCDEIHMWINLCRCNWKPKQHSIMLLASSDYVTYLAVKLDFEKEWVCVVIKFYCMYLLGCAANTSVQTWILSSQFMSRTTKQPHPNWEPSQSAAHKQTLIKVTIWSSVLGHTLKYTHSFFLSSTLPPIHQHDDTKIYSSATTMRHKKTQ